MSGPLPLEIDVGTLSRLRESGDPVTLLDVREAWELEICRIEGSRSIPLSALPARAAELPGDGYLVVVCHHGARSARATAWLRGRGFENAINLSGGIDAWALSIDTGMARY